MGNIIDSALLLEEDFLAELFNQDSRDPSLPFCYPYIIIKENGKEEEKRLTLKMAIKESLETLPLSKGRKDKLPQPREKIALTLRFGLDDGKKRSYREVGKEMGISGPFVEDIIIRAFRQLRYPSRSRRLKEFLVLSPREMTMKNKELERTKEQLRQSEEVRRQLIEALKGRELDGVEGLKSKDLTQATQFLNEDREALDALIRKCPDNRAWNAVRWSNGLDEPIRGLSQFVRAVKSGEIRGARRIGQKTEEFFKTILPEAEELLQTILPKTEPIKGAPS